ncbi:MAG: hypothetical protein Q7T07_09765 [Burkholderiaceae bacterium]|nr:hypothetical protein [Burkholderiaceae bacterium]
MEMTGFFPLLWWTLGGAGVVGAAIYLFMEYQAYLLRTSVISVPGGLRFVAQGFSVESRHAAKEVIVVAREGRYIRQPLTGGDQEVTTGSQTVTVPAVGLKIEVSRISVKGQEGEAATATGFSRIVFVASDEPMRKALGRTGGERSELRLDRVPDPIATDFQQFANGLRAWIDKVEQQVAAQAQAEAQRLRDAEAAASAAELVVVPEEDPTVPLSEADREARAGAQLEKWRTAAGFKGSSTEMSFDARGKIVWMIDLDPTGRVILHAGNRTFHGSLVGATVTGIGSEVEVAVRDDYWTEDDPRLVAFRVLGGSTPENRRAWKERLDLLIQNLGGKSAQRST